MDLIQFKYSALYNHDYDKRIDVCYVTWTKAMIKYDLL